MARATLSHLAVRSFFFFGASNVLLEKESRCSSIGTCSSSGLYGLNTSEMHCTCVIKNRVLDL